VKNLDAWDLLNTNPMMRPAKQPVKAWCSRHIPTGHMAIVIGTSNADRERALTALVKRVQADDIHGAISIPYAQLCTEIIDYKDHLSDFLVEVKA
jgi:hypothetical protein